jgi:hypothetical protein
MIFMRVKDVMGVFTMGAISTLGSLAMVKVVNVCSNPCKRAQIKKSVNNIKNQFTGNKRSESV